MSLGKISRRRLMTAGAAAAGLATIGGGNLFAAEAANVRMVWWGGDERARRTNAAVAAFVEANKDVTVETESMGWGDYWARLATQVAGGNAPDFIQMDYRFMFEYARRGAIMPLDEFMGNELQIEDFGAVNLESCSVDGKLYGGNVGVNSLAAVIEPAAWEAAGVEAPTFGTTWEAFAEKCAAFAKGTKSRISASVDASGSESTFEAWLRGNGKALYTADGELGFSGADAAEWFAYWADIRASRGCVRADVQALYKNTIETSPLSTGQAATDFAHSNQFVGYQKINSKELQGTSVPVVDGGVAGQYLKPSQMFSIAATSKHPAETARLINFLLREPAGAMILGLERGIPASPEIRELLVPELDVTSRKMIDYIGALGPYVRDLPPAPPQGAGEVEPTMLRISQSIAFGATSAKDGGAKLVDEAAAILKRG